MQQQNAESAMASDGSTSAWSALTTTTSEEAEADVGCAASRVAARPALWALVAEHSGLVGAWQLMRVCRASRRGAKEWLRTLPGLVVCGGVAEGGEAVSDVSRLDLATMRWEPMPAPWPRASITRAAR